MQGRLIVFEGVEGSGKTSQIQQLQKWLCDSKVIQQLQIQGIVSQVIATREPGGTALGQKLRHLLLHPSEEAMQDRTELLLYAADRAQHVAGFLKPQLDQGGIVLCDRFTDSTVAYQGYGRNLDRALIDQLNQIATNGLQSDLTLWLDVDVEIGLGRAQRRGASDRMEQATLTFHRRVQQGFIELAQTFPDRIVRVDASLSPEEVASVIQAVVAGRLREWYGVEDRG